MSDHRSDLIDLTVIVRRETDKAWGIASEDNHGQIIWLPKSMCEITDHNAATGRAELTCPEWLAKERGLI